MKSIGHLIWAFRKLQLEHPCIMDFAAGDESVILNGVRKENEYILLGLELPDIISIDAKQRDYSFGVVLLGYAGRDCPELGLDILIETEKILHNIIARSENPDKVDPNGELKLVKWGAVEVICDSYGDGIWGWRVNATVKNGTKWCVDANCWEPHCPDLLPGFKYKYVDGNIVITSTTVGEDSLEWFIFKHGGYLEQKTDESVITLNKDYFVDDSGCPRPVEVVLKATCEDGCKYAKLRIWCCPGKGESFCWHPDKDKKHDVLRTKI